MHNFHLYMHNLHLYVYNYEVAELLLQISLQIPKINNGSTIDFYTTIDLHIN